MIDFITHPAFLWTVFGLALSALFVWILSLFVGSYFAYTITMKKRKKEQWSTELPPNLGEDSLRMYAIGAEWAEQHKDAKQDIHIVRDGLNLYGEYYDFGHDRTVIILSGRTENHRYGYYFAIPYEKNGFNVVVLDPRAHGKSDGEFNTAGFEESKDLLAWIRFLEETYNVHSILLHGICIGSAGGMLALTSEDAPNSVDAIVAEGMFANFRESVKNHLIEQKRPVFIALDLMDMWMRHYTGHSMKYGPINVIDRMEKPLLMLHSKEDAYSTPEFAEKLYARSGSKHKRIVWFDHGAHSMLRITNTELYDRSIEEFIKEVYPNHLSNQKEAQHVL